MAELQILFNAWILSRLTYCSTVYVNMTQKEKTMLQSVLKKAYKWGLTSAEEQIDHLFQTRDKAIFSNIMDTQGYLASTLPGRRENTHRNCPSVYRSQFHLPLCRTAFMKDFYYQKFIDISALLYMHKNDRHLLLLLLKVDIFTNRTKVDIFVVDIFSRDRHLD